MAQSNQEFIDRPGALSPLVASGSNGGDDGGRSDQLLTMALEAANDGIWLWHIPSGEAYFSPRYYTMLGYEPDAFPASYESWSGLLHPEDADAARRTIRQHIESMSDGYEVEFRLRTRSGSWLWVLGRGKVIERDRDGRAVRVVGTHINIDSRKRAEKELADYRDRLEAMVRERTRDLEQTSSLLEATLNAIPDVLGVQDEEHRILRYNEAGYRLLGKSPKEVVGKRCYELIGRKSECDGCAAGRSFRTGKPETGVRYEEALEAWLDVRAYPILDAKGRVVNVIEHLRDITQEKKAEIENRKLHEQLERAGKMESLGTLAGGIAHDFNNLLMGIQGRASLMAMDLDRADPLLEHVRAIEEYIRSATWLTKQLLGFARGGKYEVKPVDINELIRSSSAMFGRTRKEIRITIDTAPRTLVVEADRRQIEQVLLNLYINAWQAMPGGGELYLQTRPVTLEAAFCRPRRMEAGSYCRISIRDTGVGMDEDTCQRIFDPFFTTKEKGRGTGLGLASAYGIIQNHGGMISVDSQPGCGATFDLFLPLSDRKAHVESPIEEGLIRGKATILLVDDEELVLDVARVMLEKLGYRVRVANGGEEAMALLEQGAAAVDLVVLDLVMPGMDGGTVFERIRAVRPGLPVILSSGYAMNDQVETVMRKGCDGFIQKPFNLNTLSTQIHQVLHHAGPFSAKPAPHPPEGGDS